MLDLSGVFPSCLWVMSRPGEAWVTSSWGWGLSGLHVYFLLAPGDRWLRWGLFCRLWVWVSVYFGPLMNLFGCHDLWSIFLAQAVLGSPQESHRSSLMTGPSLPGVRGVQFHLLTCPSQGTGWDTSPRHEEGIVRDNPAKPHSWGKDQREGQVLPKSMTGFPLFLLPHQYSSFCVLNDRRRKRWHGRTGPFAALSTLPVSHIELKSESNVLLLL